MHIYTCSVVLCVSGTFGVCFIFIFMGSVVVADVVCLFVSRFLILLCV